MLSFSLRIFLVAALVMLAGTSHGHAQNAETLPPPINRTPGVQVAPKYRPGDRLSVRIKDITDIEGIRSNKIGGFGLVIGLNGTGGNTPDTRQFALNLLENLGQRATPDIRQQIRNNTQFKTDNISLVYVTAELPAFAYQGQKIDCNVAVFDDASSLQDGKLIMTPLEGYDGEIYAISDGSISLGGFGAKGQSASIQKNALTQGRIPGGAVVENTVCPAKLGEHGYIDFHLRNADIETANRVAMAINQNFPKSARVLNQRTIRVQIPKVRGKKDLYQFVGQLQMLQVSPDSSAKIVINERTGTIIVGENVKISRLGIKIGNLTVSTTESPQVVQPAPFAQGQTAVVPRSQIDVTEDRNALNVVESTHTLVDLANSLNALGISAREMSSVLQEIKRAGQLHGELIFD